MTLISKLAAVAVATILAACGGSGDEAASSTASDTTPQISLTPAAPNDNLEAALGTVTPASATPSTFCSYTVGSNRLTGTVSRVHDGDTLTVAGLSVRLDSIDAPELVQAYGSQSRDRLAYLTLNKPVTVTYAKKDKYGRIVGSVFTSDCTLVNLDQVATGSAWYYEAYKCEIDSSTRNAYAAAQGAAKSARLGLWGVTAVAPWVYRNGVEATVPSTCQGGDSPAWSVNSTSTSSGTSTSTSTGTGTSTGTSTGTGTGTGTSSSTGSSTGTSSGTYTSSSGCSTVWVNGYRRSNGTWVNGYSRRSPGCA